MAENRQTIDQAEQYKFLNIVDRVGDLPGSNRESDTLEVIVVGEMDANIVDDDTRNVGIVTLDPTQLPLTVDQSDVVAIQEDAALDVSGAVVTIQEDTALDVSGATVPVDHQGVIDVSSRDGRNLGDVDVTSLPDHDENVENGTSLASGGSISTSLSAAGADRLRGRVVRATTSYDVTVEWLDSAGGTALFTTDVATGVAGGTETTIDELAVSPYCNVVVSDAGSGSGDVDAIFNLA